MKLYTKVLTPSLYHGDFSRTLLTAVHRRDALYLAVQFFLDDSTLLNLVLVRRGLQCYAKTFQSRHEVIMSFTRSDWRQAFDSAGGFRWPIVVRCSGNFFAFDQLVGRRTFAAHLTLASFLAASELAVAVKVFWVGWAAGFQIGHNFISCSCSICWRNFYLAFYNWIIKKSRSAN